MEISLPEISILKKKDRLRIKKPALRKFSDIM